jgi:hypothetical protein
MFVRLAFLDGWDAAMSAAAKLCDGVVEAQMEFHYRDRRQDALETARELSEEIRALASVDRSGEADETSTKIEGSSEGESAVGAAETPNLTPETSNASD